MPASRPAEHRRRAFSIIEIVIGLVLVGVLIALTVFGFNAVMTYFKDSAAQKQLTQAARAAAAVASSGSGGGITYSLASFQEATKDLTVTAAGGAPASLPLAAEAVQVVTGASTRYGELNVAISPLDASRAGLAMRTPTGRCATVEIAGTRVFDEQIVGNKSLPCLVDFADDGVLEGPANVLAPPTNVKATTNATEPDTVDLTWDAVPNATGYEVYVDGAATPITRVTGTTASVEYLSNGPHTFTVVAVRGAKKSPPSDPAQKDVSIPFNDNIANATRIGIPAYGQPLTLTANQAGATLEPGESNACGRRASVWWKFTPTRTTSIEISAPPAGQYMVVTTNTNFAGIPGCSSTALLTRYQAGTTYYLSWVTNLATPAPFTWTLQTGPDNDDIGAAAPITFPAGQDSVTFNAELSKATLEPGEPNNCGRTGSLWWKFTPERDTSYTVLGTGAGRNFNITTATNFTGVNACGDNATTQILRAGTTYYLGWARLGTDATQFSWTLQRGPANDMIADATNIAIPAGQDSATFTDVTLNMTTLEPGEPTNCGRTGSVWWKFTPDRDGSYTALGTGAGRNFNITTATNFTGVNACGDNATTQILRAGTTYYLGWARLGTDATKFSWTLQRGPANDMIADATALTTPTAGDTLSVDASHAISTLEPGEPNSCGRRGSLWWKLTPDRNFTGVFSPPSGQYMVVITSTNLGTVDGCGNSPLTYSFTKGTTYYISWTTTGMVAPFTWTLKATN